MHKPPRVLVVDDDAEIAYAVSVRLASAGYEVLSAGDAEEGLEIAREARPDVVVMDLQLPRMDGLSALTQLHANSGSDAPGVVVLSACSGERKHALELGARYFVDKPFNSRTLLAAIESSINRQVVEKEAIHE